jgi:transcriptional regulator with XRE-family HTH domain
VTSIVGERVKHYRQERKLSARALSDATESVGMRVEYNVIANMESGRRTHVSVAEVLVLAEALGVKPALLVIPLGSSEDVPVLPDVEVDAWTAYKSFTGAGMTTVGEIGGDRDNAELVNAYRRHDDALLKYWVRRDAGSDAEDVLDALINVRAEIRSRGWRVPLIPTGRLPIAAEVEMAEKDRGIAP